MALSVKLVIAAVLMVYAAIACLRIIACYNTPELMRQLAEHPPQVMHGAVLWTGLAWPWDEGRWLAHLLWLSVQWAWVSLHIAALWVYARLSGQPLE